MDDVHIYVTVLTIVLISVAVLVVVWPQSEISLGRYEGYGLTLTVIAVDNKDVTFLRPYWGEMKVTRHEWSVLVKVLCLTCK